MKKLALTHVITLQTAKIALQLPPQANLLKNLTYSSALLLTSWRLHRKQILGGS